MQNSAPHAFALKSFSDSTLLLAQSLNFLKWLVRPCIIDEEFSDFLSFLPFPCTIFCVFCIAASLNFSLNPPCPFLSFSAFVPAVTSGEHDSFPPSQTLEVWVNCPSLVLQYHPAFPQVQGILCCIFLVACPFLLLLGCLRDSDHDYIDYQCI